MSMTRQSEKL